MIPERTDASRNERRSADEDLRLRVDGVTAYYGDAQVLKGVSLQVRKNEVVAILGSNGAGKTTLLKTLTGLLRPRQGKIAFGADSLVGLSSDQIVGKGVACVPEGRQLFGEMTVADNLLLGTYCLDQENRNRMTGERQKMVFGLFPILEERLLQKAMTLSGGEQQMLALGRALMADPKLLILDEPSLGISPILVLEMMRVLKLICRDLGVSVLLVEQNARAAMRIADYVYVLERGEITLQNVPGELMSSQTIQAAYLGG